MDDLTRLRLRSQLERDEGRKNHMYPDSRGVLTIGIGHNLRDRPISDRAVDQIFEDDLLETEKELVAGIPWVTDLTGARYGVVMNMAYNLGVQGLLGFHDMLAALKDSNWERAADAMRDSKWSEQVGPRATRLERQMISGEW